MADGLNPEQARAVETLSGPLLVLAGAGTGKTRVVTYRIAELMRSGIEPQRILGVTFTNKAAAEMQERVGQLIGARKKNKPMLCTFHAHCLEVLRRHITKLGYPQKFAIYDRGDQESLARTILQEIKTPAEVLRPSDLLYLISSWKSAAIRPPQAVNVAETDREHLAAVAYRRYQQALKRRGCVDFDDLLLCTEELFSNFEEVRQEESGRYDHLLVDEYQDTNGSQYRIVKALAGGHRNLCVVGDDDQSIYGWRGAEVDHILRFHHDWPDAVVVRLEANYRSTAAIIEASNRLIAFNTNRHDKTLRAARAGGQKPDIDQYKDETAEARGIVSAIARQINTPGIEPSDFAVLFRTNEQPRVFEQEFRQANVPYVLVGGSSFFDRKEVRDILAYMKLMAVPTDDVSLRRIVNTPARGIGDTSLDSLLTTAQQQGCTLWDALASPEIRSQLPATAARGAERFVKLIEEFRQHFSRQPFARATQDLISELNYADEIRKRYPNPRESLVRMNVLEEIVNAAANFEERSKRPTLSQFLSETALDGREIDTSKDKKLKSNSVVMMTLHSAKGLEFPNVYMVGMEEGILPHKRSVADSETAISEERRLCYVGMTRAQERLTLSLARTRMKWGKPRETIPSRFLYEIIGKAENAARSAARGK
ncbi:MAG: UvrD-helicase domain-containing protein [bacterium]|nr:UvrD-helicase domain-containing protein [bacterium]